MSCDTFTGFTGDPALLTRAIPDEMLEALATGVTTLCICVRVERKDTSVLGFTTHDEDLSFGGLSYEALSSVEATALRQQIGTGIDNVDLMGLLSSDKITEDDLRATRYDGAKITLYIVDWTDASVRAVSLRGTLGELTLTDGQYRAEVRSLMQRFTQQVGNLTSPLCRWLRFGDANCEVDVSALTYHVMSDGPGSAARIFLAHLTSGVWPTATEFNHGVARCTSGSNSGLEREIKEGSGSGASRTFELQEPFPLPVAAGDLFELEIGCDRTTTRCTHFSNIVNFGGQPFIPGTDKISAQGRHLT